MKKKIKSMISHPLISGSAILLGGTLFANVFNLFFNLFMMRNLSEVEYGTLASLVSLITISIIPVNSFVPTVARFGALYLAKEDYDLLRGFFYKINYICYALGLIFLLGFIVFFKQIGGFFHITDASSIVLVGITVVFGIAGIANMGIIQAKLAFKFLSFINFIGALLKFAIGVLLVYLGFSVNGAMFAFFVSFFLPYIISFIPLKFIFKKRSKTPKVSNSEIFSYGAPSALTLLGLTSFITTDILLVKHFFDPKSAGIYAGISLIARIIFFLSAPITTVMFPLIVQKHSRNEKYHNIFKLSILLVLAPSLFIAIIYYMFPHLIISLFNKQYLPASYLLGIFGLYIAFYSLLSVLTNFYLSIKKTKVFIPISIGSLLQIVLIWFFHQSFMQVITISLSIVSLLLLILLLYYWVLIRRDEEKS